MSKKVEPTEYLDEDYLFLVLKLLDYPKMEKDEFTFSEIKTEKYKRTMVSKIFYDIINFNEQGLLKIEGLKLDGNDNKAIKKLISLMIKLPEQQEPSLNIKKMLDNNFHVYDLEIVLSCCEYEDDILNLIDFDIKINTKFKQKYTKLLKDYLKLFASGKLESPTKNYLQIESQKNNIKKKINEISKKTGSTLVLKDSDFSDDEYRFLECMLLLEKEGFLIIKNINTERADRNSSDYLVHCQLKKGDHFCSPFCKPEKGMGFLKFSKNENGIKIGRENSRHYKLLKFLLRPIGVARPINCAFECIKIDKDDMNSGINDPYLKSVEQIRILENTKKELQKEDRMRGRIKIIIDKKRRTIQAKYRNEDD